MGGWNGWWSRGLAMGAVAGAALAGAVASPGAGAALPLQLAVMGDSDSESYAGNPERGGADHARALQWTEVLARLRPDELDLGPWGSWGTPGKVVDLLRWMGLPAHGRLPRKVDYRHNFAISGAHCPALVEGESPQAVQLVRMMDREPARWRHGVVVIRIGVNDFGKRTSLDSLARDAAAPSVLRSMDKCVHSVRQAVAMVQAHYPAVRFVLVGIFDNTHWPRYHSYWRSAGELRNISAGLDYFDRQLVALAASDARIAFWDDRAWFAERWGSRDAQGEPAYRTLRLPGGVAVRNSQGDAPQHALLEDGHAGLVWNTLWAQSMVQFLNQHFAAGLRRVEDAELVRFLDTMGVGR